MTNHICLLFPILSFILHFSPKNGSYVYQTYRLSEEMLFFETLHDFYRTAILLNKDKALTGGSQCFDMAHAMYSLCPRNALR